MRREPLRKGFTLIELVVVIAIAAILLAVAVPSIMSFVQSNRIAAISNDLQQTFLSARNNAVRTGVPVAVCASSSNGGCNASSFNAGWVAFADLNRNGALLIASSTNFGNAVASGTTDLVVLRRSDVNANLRLSVSTASSVTSYRYLPTGRAEMYNGTWGAPASLLVCDSSSNTSLAKKIVFTSSGRPYVSALDVGDACP